MNKYGVLESENDVICDLLMTGQKTPPKNQLDLYIHKGHI